MARPCSCTSSPLLQSPEHSHTTHTQPQPTLRHDEARAPACCLRDLTLKDLPPLTNPALEPCRSSDCAAAISPLVSRAIRITHIGNPTPPIHHPHHPHSSARVCVGVRRGAVGGDGLALYVKCTATATSNEPMTVTQRPLSHPSYHGSGSEGGERGGARLCGLCSFGLLRMPLHSFGVLPNDWVPRGV